MGTGKRSYGSQNGVDKSPRQKGKVGASYDAPFRGYINLNLSDEQKASFEVWAASEAPWDALAGFVSDGVNLSLRIDPKSGGFLASATQRREDSPNAGLVVTARASGAAKALFRVLFCLVVLSHEERWESTQPLADPDRW